MCVFVCFTNHVHVKQWNPLSFQVFVEAGFGRWDVVLVALPVLCFHANIAVLEWRHSSTAGVQHLQEVNSHQYADHQ